MSFSSTSSKQSSPIQTKTNETNGNVLHSSLSEPGNFEQREQQLLIHSFSAISVTTPVSDVPSTKPIAINGKMIVVQKPIINNLIFEGNDTKHAVVRPNSSTQSNTDSTQK